MSAQRPLFALPPATLTDRQAQALEHLQNAGADGLTGADLGRLMGSGPHYAKTVGLELLRVLKKKGHARSRRAGVWVAVRLPVEATADQEIPY